MFDKDPKDCDIFDLIGNLLILIVMIALLIFFSPWLIMIFGIFLLPWF
jgi:hypothetical protein